MKKLAFLTLLFLPLSALAQSNIPNDQIFKARVAEIIDERTEILPDGAKSPQQKLKLVGLEGEFKDKEIIFDGIGEIDVLNTQAYAPGDKVLAAASYTAEGEAQFYIVDYVRSRSLWLLAGVFLLALIIVGRFKGLRSLIALALSFIVIIKFIIPRILSGASPLIATLSGSFIILFIIIYITEGFKARAHLSAVSISISLAITVILSQLFVGLARLTGAAGEEVLFLIDINSITINLQGLLLAGIIIGALGVLDDVIISQVATVEQIAVANPGLRKKELFKQSYSVGVSHIASMANTLFLAYAGVSLPLLILFVSGGSAFTGWQQAINTELVATEIVRTLSGSIGLILSVPIATYIAVWWYSWR